MGYSKRRRSNKLVGSRRPKIVRGFRAIYAKHRKNKTKKSFRRYRR